jgi:hypothetical protein
MRCLHWYLSRLSKDAVFVSRLVRSPSVRSHFCRVFLFALFKYHCGSPHVFINEEGKGRRNGSVVSQKWAHTIVLELLCCRFVVAT